MVWSIRIVAIVQFSPQLFSFLNLLQTLINTLFNCKKNTLHPFSRSFHSECPAGFEPVQQAYTTLMPVKRKRKQRCMIEAEKGITTVRGSVTRFSTSILAWIEPIWAPDKQIKMVFLKNSFLQRYSNLKLEKFDSPQANTERSQICLPTFIKLTINVAIVHLYFWMF